MHHIESTSDFELTTAPQLNILTYRYTPAAARAALGKATGAVAVSINDALSDLNELIQKEQRARGKTFVSRTRFELPQHQNQPCSVFRVVLANPLTTRQILSDILDEQRMIGNHLMAGRTGIQLQSLCAQFSE